MFTWSHSCLYECFAGSYLSKSIANLISWVKKYCRKLCRKKLWSIKNIQIICNTIFIIIRSLFIPIILDSSSDTISSPSSLLAAFNCEYVNNEVELAFFVEVEVVVAVASVSSMRGVLPQKLHLWRSAPNISQTWTNNSCYC